MTSRSGEQLKQKLIISPLIQNKIFQGMKNDKIHSDEEPIANIIG